MTSAYRAIKASYLLSLLKGIVKYRKIGNDKNFVIRKTPGKGQGLFTTIPRKKGSLVFIATGKVKIAHFKGADCYTHPDWYGVDKDTWIDIQAPFIKINHSCYPNTAIDGHRCFRALRDIAAEEEVTFDYSISDDELDWTMTENCQCNSGNCARKIGPVQTMSEERFQNSYPYIPLYFQKVYRDTHTKIERDQVINSLQPSINTVDL